MENETVWLSLNQIAQLFKRDKSVVSRHIKNIFEEQELFENLVVANFATTATDGKIYQVEHFNLDVIISVGYRVNSKQGTQFSLPRAAPSACTGLSTLNTSGVLLIVNKNVKPF